MHEHDCWSAISSIENGVISFWFYINEEVKLLMVDNNLTVYNNTNQSSGSLILNFKKKKDRRQNKT